MATNYTWNVVSMNAIPQIDGKDNVVVEVVYKVSNGVVSANNMQIISFSEEGVFTPFDSLTEPQVIGWVQSALKPSGVTAVQDAVDALLDPAVLPTDVPVPQDLPWVAKDEPVQTNLAEDA